MGKTHLTILATAIQVRNYPALLSAITQQEAIAKERYAWIAKHLENVVSKAIKIRNDN